jgi:class 3 adenylate cyclase
VTAPAPSACPFAPGCTPARWNTGPPVRSGGIAVHTGARVAALAGAGEILVSRTIRDLVAGAPIRLESRGTHELKGVPGSWEIFAVAG